MTTAAQSGDRVLRAMTDDDTFRVITASTTDTVRQVLASQSVAGPAARHLADLVTGTVLIRETMAPHYRVQGLLKGTGGNLLADSHPDGLTRGLAQLPKDPPTFEIGPGTKLQMMRSTARGSIHRSVVEPPLGGGVPEALMAYMKVSEQIVTMIATGVCWDGDAIRHAGGYVVQLLPGPARGTLMVMTERLAALPSFDQMLADLHGSPSRLLDELLYQMPYAHLDDRPVTFGCKCSREAVVGCLSTLPRDELADLLREQPVVELSCDYCHTVYHVARGDLTGLLETS
jgi:molecular chaperone Hsp33